MSRINWVFLRSSLLVLGLWSASVQAQQAQQDQQAQQSQDNCTRIVFDASGRLISATPSDLIPQQCLRFAVSLPQAEADAPRLAALRQYFDALAGVQKEKTNASANQELWGQPHFGLDRATLDAVHGELCAEAHPLARDLDGKTQDRFYQDRLEALGCPKAPAPPGGRDFVPPISDLANIGFKVQATCLSELGAFVAIPVKDLTEQPKMTAEVDLDQTENGVGGEVRLSGNGLVIPAQCSRLTYELRRTNPLSQIIQDRWRVHQDKLDAGLVAARENAIRILTQSVPEVGGDTLASVMARWSETTKLAQTALDKIRLGGIPTVEEQQLLETRIGIAGGEIATASNEVQKALDKLHQEAVRSGWVAHWLWLSRGQPSLDPFLASSDGDQLAALRSQLATLDADLKNFDLLATNDGFNLANVIRLDQDLSPWGKKRVEREKLAQQIQALERRIARADDLALDDALLYQGLFPAGPHAVMRHHDALNRYILLDREPIREVAENGRLFVLVANETPATRLKLAVTVTPILADVAPITEQVALSASDLAAADLAHELSQTAPIADPGARARMVTLRDKIESFLTSFRRLVQRVELLQRVSAPPPFPIERRNDTTPVLVSRIVPHDVPKAPSLAAYEIKTEKDGAADTVVAASSYRVNKLYSVRFRTGFLYSQLETSDFTITNGQATEEVKQHGADGTFGVQIYPWPRDIRSNDDRWIPVFFLGLSMKSTKDNLFGAIGLEPYSGVTAMIGKHYGRGERLLRDDTGAPRQITDTWKNDWFFSLTVDVDFFKRLLSLADVLP